MDDNRGKIRNEKFAKILTNFGSIRYGNKTPMDIDLIFDFNNVAWVIGEIKFGNVEPSTGQKKCYDRLYNDLSLSKPTLLIYCNYTDLKYNKIELADCSVVKYKLNKKWLFTRRVVTVRELINWFLIKYGGLDYSSNNIVSEEQAISDFVNSISEKNFN